VLSAVVVSAFVWELGGAVLSDEPLTLEGLIAGIVVGAAGGLAAWIVVRGMAADRRSGRAHV